MLTRCPDLLSCLAQHPDEAQFEEAGAMNVFFYLQRVRAVALRSRMRSWPSIPLRLNAISTQQHYELHAVKSRLA